MKVEIDVGEATLEECNFLSERLRPQALELLRRYRRQFEVGDRVRDVYGRALWVADITNGEFELRDEEGFRIWKAAKVEDIEEIL